MVWSTIQDTEPLFKKDDQCAPPRQSVAENTHNFLEHCSALSINSAPALVRLTGIICTIGPATNEVPVLEKMMETGMNIVRINCSYATHSLLAEQIMNVRTAAENYSRRLGTTYPIGVALDITGPEIRTGFVEGGKVKLIKGDLIKLTPDKAYYEKGTAGIVYIDYDNFHKCVQLGNKIYLNDGLVSIIISNIQGSVVTCTVEEGGMLGSCRVVNLPGINTDLPTISEKDKEDILFGLEQDVDFLFLSYISQAAPLYEVKDLLGQRGNKIVLVAKIETQQGIHNLPEILKVTDGIMVGRGDLGVELPIEKLFLAQKYIMSKCNLLGKPVICANQMLESMKSKARPTRAEALDVANAVLDGADCVMLTNETIEGHYPVESVYTMAKVCKEAESAVWHRRLFVELVGKVVPPVETSHAVALAAVETASKCLAAAIIVITTSGRSAYLLARYKPKCPIIAVTRNPQTARQAHLFRGVLPLIYLEDRLEDWAKDVEARISFALSFGKWRKIIKGGDPVIAINGSKKGSGYTDRLRVLYVTKPADNIEDCECDYEQTGV